jgi:hypothetical protein
VTSCLPALKQRLDDAAIGTPVILDRMPDQPDQVVTMIERPATSSKDYDARNLPALETFRVQLITRAGKDDGVATAEAIAWTAYRNLVGRHLAIAVDGETQRLDWVRAQHTPASTGFDELDRPLAVVNLVVQRHGDLGAR